MNRTAKAIGRTKKFKSRIYIEVPTKEVQPGDIIVFNDNGSYTRIVKSVAKSTVMVEQPKDFKPRTKRVNRKCIKETWRWHKKMEDTT